MRCGVVLQANAGEDAGSGCRVGFTATKKIGGAVKRNRAKRRLREIANMLVPLHGTPGTDYVFIARAATPSRPWNELVDDVKSALLSLAPKGGR